MCLHVLSAFVIISPFCGRTHYTNPQNLIIFSFVSIKNGVKYVIGILEQSIIL